MFTVSLWGCYSVMTQIVTVAAFYLIIMKLRTADREVKAKYSQEPARFEPRIFLILC